MFTYVSLFAGIGGFDSAFNKLGGKCVLASEIDPKASASYKAIYGENPVGDITRINTEDIPNHDILLGGFPCQPFSTSGHRRGFKDTRGTLFFEVLRIAESKQPKAILLENVKGLVSHDKGETLRTMISSLSDIEYFVDFKVLNSKYFGVPQNRDRLFMVAIRKDLVKKSDWDTSSGCGVSKVKKTLQKIEGFNTFNFNFPNKKEITVTLEHILESEVNESHYISKELKGQDIKGTYCTDPNLIYDSQGFVKRKSFEVLNKFGYLPRMYNAYNKSIIKDFSPTLTTSIVGASSSGQVIINRDGRLRKLTPKECFRLQGFSDSQYEKASSAGITDTQLYKQAGNAVTVNVIEALGRELLDIIS